MSDKAKYVGPHENLRGKVASVVPNETYELPLERRTLSAWFEEAGLEVPEWPGVDLGRGWHTFPAKDFKLLVVVTW